MRVRATELGYYGDRRQREGQVFTLAKPEHFSAKWMEKLDGGKGGKKAGAGARAATKVQAPVPSADDLYPDDDETDESQDDAGATGDQEVI